MQGGSGSIPGELRSHMLRSAAKKRKKKNPDQETEHCHNPQNFPFSPPVTHPPWDNYYPDF